MCTLSPEPIAVQCQHIKSIATLISNKTNCNRTEFASLFRSPQAGLGLAIAVIYTIYGVKKLFFGKTRQGAKKVSFTACIWASCSQRVLAHKSFQNPFWLAGLITIFLLSFEFPPKNNTCMSGKLRTKITSPTVKSNSLRLLDTTFFARCQTTSFISVEVQHYP